jgi:hypothetical protein
MGSSNGLVVGAGRTSSEETSNEGQHAAAQDEPCPDRELTYAKVGALSSTR